MSNRENEIWTAAFRKNPVGSYAISFQPIFMVQPSAEPIESTKICYASSASSEGATVTTIVKKKSPIVVPESLRRRAGIKPGDRLEFHLSGGIINIIPKLPSADDEYTPAQRRVIDVQLKEAAKGPYYGPFDTADAAIKFLNQRIRKRKAGKTKSTKT